MKIQLILLKLLILHNRFRHSCFDSTLIGNGKLYNQLRLELPKNGTLLVRY